MTTQQVALTIAGRVAHLRLSAPERRNAIGLRFCQDFAAAAAAAEAAADVAVIVVSAQGDAFSVGGDIREFVAEKARVEDHARAMTAALHDGVLRLQRAAAPVLAAVGGVAAGAGFSLVCGADLVLAAKSARFTSAYTRSGLTPDGGGTWFLPRIVGFRRAFELMALNPVLGAADARALGLVTRVVEDSALAEETETTARQLAAIPPGGLAGLKRLLRASREASLADQLAAEADSIARLLATPTTMAALEGFLTKR